MLDLDKLLADAEQRAADKPETATADIYVAGKLLTLKFSELDGDAWAACTMANLPRKGVPLDHAFSYNITAAAKSAAPLSGVLVDGDDELKLSDEQWSKVWRTTDPQGRQAITDAIFAVNEHAQLARLDAARKGFEAVSKRKPRSPAK
jgi:hypothetical protein